MSNRHPVDRRIVIVAEMQRCLDVLNAAKHDHEYPSPLACAALADQLRAFARDGATPAALALAMALDFFAELEALADDDDERARVMAAAGYWVDAARRR